MFWFLFVVFLLLSKLKNKSADSVIGDISSTLRGRKKLKTSMESNCLNLKIWISLWKQSFHQNLGVFDSFKKAIQFCDNASLIDVLYSEWILLKINNINYNFVIFSTETLLWFSYKKAIKNTSLHLNANDVQVLFLNMYLFCLKIT